MGRKHWRRRIYFTAWSRSEGKEFGCIFTRHIATDYSTAFVGCRSDGHKSKPPGLIVDRYFHGFLQAKHVKTIALSEEVLRWGFSLFPHVLSSNEYYQGNYTKAQYFESESLHDQRDRDNWYKSRQRSFPITACFNVFPEAFYVSIVWGIYDATCCQKRYFEWGFESLGLERVSTGLQVGIRRGLERGSKQGLQFYCWAWITYLSLTVAVCIWHRCWYERLRR